MKLIRAGLIALAMAGLFAIPIQEAAATTTCKVTTVNGHETKRVCTTQKKPSYRKRTRTVCHTYWRHGVKHRSCRRVRR